MSRYVRESHPLISVIVPTRNSAGTLPRLLESIRSQTYSRYEVLVVDNCSSDGTSRIAQEHGCRFLHAGPERSAQRNAGVSIANGALLLFVDDDMELAPDGLEKCATASQACDGLCLKEVTTGDNFWARVRSFERSHYFGSDLFEAARCLWRDCFEYIGGYDTKLTGLEDYDLHARFLEAGFRLGWVDATLLHHEESLDLFGYLKKRRYYGKTDSVYASRHPSRWREQRSVIPRMRLVLSNRIMPSDLALLAGLVVMRGLEWSLRKYGATH